MMNNKTENKKINFQTANCKMLRFATRKYRGLREAERDNFGNFQSHSKRFKRNPFRNVFHSLPHLKRNRMHFRLFFFGSLFVFLSLIRFQLSGLPTIWKLYNFVCVYGKYHKITINFLFVANVSVCSMKLVGSSKAMRAHKYISTRYTIHCQMDKLHFVH